jgi:hypothetical protein
MTDETQATTLDHARIQAEGLVERYVADRLPPPLRQAFEAHLVDCAPCLDLIEEAERLRAGLVGVARAEAAPVAPVVDLVSHRQRLATWGLAAGLAAAGVAAVLLQRQVREVRAELASARADATESARRAEADGAALRAAQASRSQLEERVAQLALPRITPVFAMAISRGAAPSRVLRIPREPQWVVLSLEAGGDPEYRAVLRAATGRLVWEGRRLLPDGDGIAVTLLSDLLPPGDYVMGLTSTAGPGRGEEVRFAFRTEWAR